MSTAKQLFDAAFAKPRDMRSGAYKAGVLAILEHRLREPGAGIRNRHDKQYKGHK
jgi:hypothetical protein